MQKEQLRLLSDEGAMARVYLGEDSYDNPTIVKVYRPEIIRSYDYYSMVKKAYEIRRRHPNLAQNTLSWPSSGEFEFEKKIEITLNYIEGTSLEKRPQTASQMSQNYLC